MQQAHQESIPLIAVGEFGNHFPALLWGLRKRDLLHPFDIRRGSHLHVLTLSRSLSLSLYWLCVCVCACVCVQRERTEVRKKNWSGED